MHDADGREDLDADHLRRVGVARLGPLGDPSRDQAVGGGAGLDELATAMGNDRRGLEQQQAFVGRCGGDPPSPGLLDEVFVILGGFEAEEGEPEAVLAPALAVATATVAAVFRENRDDPAEKLHRRIVPEPLHDQRNAGLGELGEAGHG